MYAHSYTIIGKGEDDPFWKFTHKSFSLGSFCVIIFFVISGFLIARSFENSKSLLQYTLARVLRIYPALIVTVLLSVFVLGLLSTTLSTKAYLSDKQTYEYLLNVFSLKIYFYLPGVFSRNPLPDLVNGCIWSLPYELSCYVLIAMFGSLKNGQLRRTALILALLMVSYFFIGFSQWRKIFELSAYFLGGSAIYICRKHIILNKYLALGALLLLALTLHVDIHKEIKNLAIVLLLPYIIISLSYIKSFLNRFAQYGDFSYGIYIFGFPIQQIVIQAFPSSGSLANFLFSFLISLVMAYFSWHLIENKFLKYKKYAFSNKFAPKIV